MADGEQLSWMLVNNVELLINLCDEPPVFELISSVHRNSAASGLVVQAIATRCADITDVINQLFSKIKQTFKFVCFSRFFEQNV